MDIRVQFHGGPMHLMYSRVESLNDVKAFFPPAERRIIVYRRDPMICELCYFFDLDLSTGLTEKYDEAFALFNNKEPANFKFEDDQPAPDGDGGIFNADQTTIIGGSGFPEPEEDAEDVEDDDELV